MQNTVQNFLRAPDKFIANAPIKELERLLKHADKSKDSHLLSKIATVTTFQLEDRGIRIVKQYPNRREKFAPGTRMATLQHANDSLETVYVLPPRL